MNGRMKSEFKRETRTQFSHLFSLFIRPSFTSFNHRLTLQPYQPGRQRDTKECNGMLGFYLQQNDWFVLFYLMSQSCAFHNSSFFALSTLFPSLLFIIWFVLLVVLFVNLNIYLLVYFLFLFLFGLFVM